MEKKIGRYEIIRELGRGGMAVVYLARDPKFKRQVAIKILPQQLTFDPQFRARFEREAEVIASLEHASIVPVYDYSEEDGQPYLVMRYMPGGSLRERIQRKRLTLTETQQIVERITPALQKAHGRGVIHRDLKPENILFDGDGEPAISDFGIAKLAESSQALSGSLILGTLAYMSPEQAQGKAKIDGRSDQYSLAVMIYEMLTRKALFKANTPMGLVHAHVSETPPSILKTRKDLPAELGAVLDKALSKSPKDRYRNVQVFASEFRKAIPDRPSKTSENLIPVVKDGGVEDQAAPRTRQLGAELTGEEPDKAESRPNFWKRTTAFFSVAILRIGTMRIPFWKALVVMFLIGAGSLATWYFAFLLPANPATAPTSSPLPQTTTVVQTETQGESEQSTPTENSPSSTPTETPTVFVQPVISMENYSLIDKTVVLDGQARAVTDISFSPDGELLASVSSFSTVLIWGVSDYALESTLPGGTVYSQARNCISFSPDGETLAVGGDQVNLWQVRDGSLLNTLPGQGTGLYYSAYGGIQHKGRCVAFSSGGELLTGGPGGLQLWDTTGAFIIRDLASGWINSLTFSPDGSIFAVTHTYTLQVQVYRSSDGNLLRTVKIPFLGFNYSDQQIEDLAFSPDGSILVAGLKGGQLLLWHVNDGEFLNILEGHTSSVNSLTFSPDGSILASGSSDGTIRLWQASDGRLLKVLLGGDEVGSVVFSPDGTLLASGSSEGTVIVWGIP